MTYHLQENKVCEKEENDGMVSDIVEEFTNLEIQTTLGRVF